MVHYQIPASVDIYVHRSGRTARGDADGLAIALVAPKEAPRYTALQQVTMLLKDILQRVQNVLSISRLLVTGAWCALASPRATT